MTRLNFVCSFLAAAILITLVLTSSMPGQTQDQVQSPTCAIPVFSVSTTINASNGRAVVVGDFNKDNKQDVAVARSGGVGSVSLALGNGLGGFSAPTNTNLTATPTSLAAADFNGDGNLDLVVGHENSTQTKVSVLISNGAGGFNFPLSLSLTPGQQNRITAVATADLNNDTKQDIVAVSATFHAAVIFRGEGNGQFTFIRNVSTGGFIPLAVAVRDLNNDNKLDLAIVDSISSANPNLGSLSVLLGDGALAFSSASVFSVGAFPVSVAIADFNGDSKPDAAVANAVSHNVSILSGDGTGNFGAPTTVQTGGESPLSVVAGDFTGDIKFDLAVFNGRPGNLVILVNDGLGNLAPKGAFKYGNATSLADGISATSADFNQDNAPDLVVVTTAPFSGAPVLLNSCGSALSSTTQVGAASFGITEEGMIGVNNSLSIAVTRTGDITGASAVNYATSSNTALAVQDFIPVSGTLSFAPGESFKQVTITIINDEVTEGQESFDFTLSNVTGSSTLATPASASIVIQDFDPAPVIGGVDLSVTEGNSGTTSADFLVSLNHASSFPVSVNYATSDGTASAGVDYQSKSGTLNFSPGEVSKTVSVLVNGDTVGEINENFLLTLSTPTNATIGDAQLLGTILDDDSSCPGPSFGAATNFTVGTSPFAQVHADFNGDSKVDLAVANRGSNNVSLLIGNGTGGFAPAVNFPLGNRPISIATGDFNLDLKPDLITVNDDLPTRSILLNNGAGGFLPAVSATAPVNVQKVVVADVNADTKPDIAFISFASGSGVGSLSVSLGDGTGSFGSPTSYAIGTTPLDLIVANLNADNKPDLITANQNTNNVSILLNNGDGTYAAATSVSVAAAPQSVAAGDFNSDGKVDLILSHLNPGSVTLLLGDGNGGFGIPANFTLGDRLFRVHAADLNADGKLDVVVTEAGTSAGLWVLFGNGAGGFTSPAFFSLQSDVFSVTSADLDGNGRLDLAATHGSVAILLNTCSLGSASSVQFSASSREVQESANAITVNVVRSGNTQVASSVSYSSSDLGVTSCTSVNSFASSRCDYLITLGTLDFAAGETSKTLTIPIADDSYSEGDEEFSLTLSNPVNASIAFPSSVRITIKDNDSSEGPNPIDAHAFFVRQHYTDFLNRVPDQAGLDFWISNFTDCNGDVQCLEVKRINVSAAFFLSTEFQETGYLVERLYKAGYGDAVGQSTLGGAHQLPVPVVRFDEFLSDTQRIGKDVVVGQGNWQQKIEDNKRAFIAEFVARSRFLLSFPNSMSATEFVNKLNENSGNVLSPSKRTELINGLTGGTLSRAEVVRAVAEDTALVAAEFNRAFVLMQYFGYLRRNPNDSPDSDHGGYDFWLTKLNNFNGNFSNAEMVKAFLLSGEYRHRFGP